MEPKQKVGKEREVKKEDKRQDKSLKMKNYWHYTACTFFKTVFLPQNFLQGHFLLIYFLAEMYM